MINNTQDFWEDSWTRHIDSYLNYFPRVGVFLEKYFGSNHSFLEVAGGSCRDSRYLAKLGFKAVGSDFDEKTINYLSTQKFPNDVLEYSVEDAFNMSFQNNSFDVVFHNGFLIYFSNNLEIYDILREQARVAKKYVVFFVHNIENIKLIKQFNDKSVSDKLYDIRFFNKSEVTNIVQQSGVSFKNIKLMKFGNVTIDKFYYKKLKKVILNPLYGINKKIIPIAYQYQPWKNVERICCVIELDI